MWETARERVLGGSPCTISSSAAAPSSTAPVPTPAPPTSRSPTARSPRSARSTARAGSEIDADGLLVTPGWVDIHTHYDGQATWDDVLAPTAWHGVTTLVMGNCGVGFAPARPDQHDWLIGLMEGVEDIPGTALAEGIDVGLGDLPRVPRRARHPALAARRRHAGRARRGPRLRDGRARRPQRAGHPRGHRGDEGHRARRRSRPARSASRRRARSPTRPSTASPCPARSPPRTSCSASAPRSASSAPACSSWPRRARPARTSSRRPRRSPGCASSRPPSAGPVTFALLQVDAAPDLWRELMAESLAAAAEGAELWPQVAGRATGMLTGPLHRRTACSTRSPPTATLKRRGLARGRVRRGAARPRGAPGHRRVAARPRDRGPHEGRLRVHLLARHPARLRAERRALHRRRGRRHRAHADRGRLRRDARGRRPGAALPADPQLLVGQPRAGPRDAAAPAGGPRPVRRRRPLRRDLRRLAAHVHAHPLDPRPHPGRAACRSSGW